MKLARFVSPHEAFVIEIGRADVHLYTVSRVFDLEARVLPSLDEELILRRSWSTVCRCLSN